MSDRTNDERVSNPRRGNDLRVEHAVKVSGAPASEGAHNSLMALSRSMAADPTPTTTICRAQVVTWAVRIPMSRDPSRRQPGSDNALVLLAFHARPARPSRWRRCDVEYMPGLALGIGEKIFNSVKSPCTLSILSTSAEKRA